MATRAEIRAQRREERRQERTQKRQATRQAKAGQGLFSGIGARMQQRQSARQERKSDRIGARSARIQSRSEGGFYDPESVAARYGAASSIAGTIGAAVGGGGVSGLAEQALGALTGGDPEGGELVELYPADDEGMGFLVPALVAGAVVGGYLLLRKPKAKGKKK